jgi:hypothetical protein
MKTYFIIPTNENRELNYTHNQSGKEISSLSISGNTQKREIHRG